MTKKIIYVSSILLLIIIGIFNELVFSINLLLFTLILLCAILIIPHEFGHFFAAKLVGLKPKEFAIGMGPVLLSKKYKETEYSLRMLPIGGYIKIDDEDENSEYNHLKWYKKVLILISGVIMNVVSAIIVISIASLFLMETQTSLKIDKIYHYFGDEYMVGLENGDEIIGVDGEIFDTVNTLLYYVSLSSTNEFDFTVIRDGETIIVDGVLLPTTDVSGLDNQPFFSCTFIDYDVSLYDRISDISTSVSDSAAMVVVSGEKIISGDIPISAMSSIIGIADLLVEYVEYGMYYILKMIGVVMINLAIINLLPIPALDGGQIIIVICESIFNKKFNQKAINAINTIFLAALMSLSFFVMANDVLKIIYSYTS